MRTIIIMIMTLAGTAYADTGESEICVPVSQCTQQDQDNGTCCNPDAPPPPPASPQQGIERHAVHLGYTLTSPRDTICWMSPQDNGGWVHQCSTRVVVPIFTGQNLVCTTTTEVTSSGQTYSFTSCHLE